MIHEDEHWRVGAAYVRSLRFEPYVSLTFQPYVKKNGKRKTL